MCLISLYSIERKITQQLASIVFSPFSMLFTYASLTISPSLTDRHHSCKSPFIYHCFAKTTEFFFLYVKHIHLHCLRLFSLYLVLIRSLPFVYNVNLVSLCRLSKMIWLISPCTTRIATFQLIDSEHYKILSTFDTTEKSKLARPVPSIESFGVNLL